VYASYDWRRDLAAAAKPTPQMLEAARPLTEAEVESGLVAAGRAGMASGGGSGSSSSSGSSGGGMSGGQGGGASGGGRGSGASSSGGSEVGSSSRGSGGGGCGSGGDGGGGSGGGGPAATLPLQQPDMPLAIAWALCYRGLKRAQITSAVAQLKAALGAEDVRDLRVSAGGGGGAGPPWLGATRGSC
jgi:hypothetical protein